MSSRRRFLKGLGGLTLGLPFLPSIHAARAAGPPVYSVFVRAGNGVAQEEGDEPERFWPSATGALTAASLAADTDRSLSVLAPWAEKTIAVKGLDYPFGVDTCGHSNGGNQCLTAASYSGQENYSLAQGESVDNRIARASNRNGGEPLTLYTGPRYGYLEEVLSYRGPGDIRPAEDDPWRAYQRMLGGETGAFDALLGDRRTSVNDLVLSELNDLRGSADLSASDKRRLDLHLDSVRDFETLACRLTDDEEQAMALVTGLGTLNDNRITFAKMHMDLIALAFACDYARTGTLQIGDGNDGTEYTIDGQRLPSFHWISHRIYSDGDEGEAIEGAFDMHVAIDRLMLETFTHLLTRLDEHGLTDDSIAVWLNDLGAGVSHRYTDVPWILVGGAAGALRTGQFVDAGGVTHDRLLNTVLTAAGVEGANGGAYTDFGADGLEGGVLDELLA
ncbi:MAG: DUF1552 domain-containing protein [Proteobacteria bacterium]|nr:DUF1552 domain-containing protein [Pseudomonadota bacterium]MCP4922046.1 DUF1552 domain-containing protein [Pseudomonadota bacterium]